MNTSNEQPFDNYLTRHLTHTLSTNTHEHKRQYIVRNYLDVLPKSLDASILEIGPGFGELLRFLVIERNYKNVTAVDLSEEVANRCNDITPNTCTVVSDTPSWLSIQTRRFDQVFMLHVLEHVPKQHTMPLLRAIYSALKPGGILIVEVPNMANPITGTAMRFDDFTHEVGFTDLSLHNVLQSAGFDQIEVCPIQVPITSIPRIVQSVLSSILTNFLLLLRRVYMPSKPKILSPVIYAIASKK